ncbi:hypothetical protein CRUP_036404 [Coryphaenoides rupestris]|nr:hypothetical protein CRUP_036404 [Coryphaenoides rupestris]
MCQNRQCIPKHYVCDHDTDCSDGSDESMECVSPEDPTICKSTSDEKPFLIFANRYYLRKINLDRSNYTLIKQVLHPRKPTATPHPYHIHMCHDHQRHHLCRQWFPSGPN